MKSIPKHFQPQSSEEPPPPIGVSFSADVARRHQQLILVLRETVSSYTLTTLIKSEKHEDLRNAIIVLCSQLRSLHDGGATVRVDPAPGFCALATDPILLSHGITLEIGRVKNPNKNPVAERAIEELGLELLNLSPEGGPVSDVILALATANTNSRIRRDGLSAFVRTFLVSSGSSPPPSFTANSTWCLCLNVIQWLRQFWLSPRRAPSVAFTSPPH